MSTLEIIARYGLGALRLMPLVLSLVSEAVDAVEAIGGPGTGEAKKAAVLDAVDAAFDLQAASAPDALPLDRVAFRALASQLVETALSLQRARAEREG
jgi:hypothetical protein